MEQSPLTHQPRPEVFQPKIVQLYDELLDHPDHLPSDGFWAEFFLLRPDRRALRERLDALTAGDLLVLEVQTRQLFHRAVGVMLAGGAAGAGAGAGAAGSALGPHANGHLRNGSASVPAGRSFAGGRPNGALSRTSTSSSHHLQQQQQHGTSPAPLAPPSFSSPSSPAAVENTLATLATFLSAVLSKKYNNPSSDVIDLLAGLDRVDAVLSDFVAALDQLLRYGKTATIRRLAVQVALAMTAGAYQTTLLTYFIQRDLFPSIIKVGVSSSLVFFFFFLSFFLLFFLFFLFCLFLSFFVSYPLLTSAGHRRRTRRHGRALYARRPAGQLQQVRVPEPVPATAQRLCQRAGHPHDPLGRGRRLPRPAHALY